MACWVTAVCLPDRKCTLPLRSPSLLGHAGCFLYTSFRLLTSPSSSFQHPLIAIPGTGLILPGLLFLNWLSLSQSKNLSQEVPREGYLARAEASVTWGLLKSALFNFLWPFTKITCLFRSWNLFCFGVCVHWPQKDTCPMIYERVVSLVCMATGEARCPKLLRGHL